MYQQTRLSDTSAIGAPGDLPTVIATWGDAPDLLADLTGHVDPQFGFDGTGFWPVDVTAPAVDATFQVLVPPTACEKADHVVKRWTATATVRPMTTEELLVSDPVPYSPTNYQCRVALVQVGLFTKVDAAIKGADMTVQANQEALQAWEYANNFYRDQDFVVALGPSFGLRPADIDNLFRAAGKVP